jgi:hypothetical protein
MSIDADLLDDGLSSAMGSLPQVGLNSRYTLYWRGKVFGSRPNCKSAPRFEAILFSASVQLVSNDLLSCHGGGAAEDAAVEREGAQTESDCDKQNKRNRQTQIRHSSPRKR